MNDPIATIKKTRAIQEKYQVFTKKVYGQNFIIEPRIVEKIADAAIANPKELVIEIGPGIGALTQQLCARAQRVIAYEIDPRMPEILTNEINSPHLDVILQDFLNVDVDEEIKKYRKDDQPVVFASNLPYYITTPILFQLFEAKEPIERITVMMQKEVGQRFMAQPSDKEYNALSVIWQYKCDCHKVMDVSRHVFWPSPNVDSVVLQFNFHHRYHLPHESIFLSMVKGCFVQRRKTIYNNLQSYLNDKELAKTCLENAGIALHTRAQQCALKDFIRLYEVNYESICASQSESSSGCDCKK